MSAGTCRAAVRTATASPPPRCSASANRGRGLLVTVDCGITAVERGARGSCRRARCRGHRPSLSARRRRAARLSDRASGPVPVSRHGPVRDRGRAQAGRGARCADSGSDLELVALATVADLMPLRGENRRLVRDGLVQMAGTAAPGPAGVDAGLAHRSERRLTRPASASGWRRGSTPRAACGAPTPVSNCC